MSFSLSLCDTVHSLAGEGGGKGPMVNVMEVRPLPPLLPRLAVLALTRRGD
jgi:hypothetical protein